MLVINNDDNNLNDDGTYKTNYDDKTITTENNHQTTQVEPVEYTDFPTDGGLRVYLKYDATDENAAKGLIPHIYVWGASRWNLNPNLGSPMNKIVITEGTHAGTYYYWDFGKYVGWNQFLLNADGGDKFGFELVIPSADTSTKQQMDSKSVTQWKDWASDATRNTSAPRDLIYDYSSANGIVLTGWGPEKDYMTKTQDQLFDENGDKGVKYYLVTSSAIGDRGTRIPMTRSRRRFDGQLNDNCWTVFFRASELSGDITYHIEASNGDQYRPATDGYNIYSKASTNSFLKVNGLNGSPVNPQNVSVPIEYGSVGACRIAAADVASDTRATGNYEFALAKSSNTQSYTISLNASEDVSFTGHPYQGYSVSVDENDAISALQYRTIYLGGNIVMDDITKAWGAADLYSAFTGTNKADYLMEGNYTDGYRKTIYKPATGHFRDLHLVAVAGDRVSSLNTTTANSKAYNVRSTRGINGPRRGHVNMGSNEPLASTGFASLILPQVQDGQDATALEGGIFIGGPDDKKLKDPWYKDFTSLSQTLSPNVNDDLYDAITVILQPDLARYLISPITSPYIIGPAAKDANGAASFPAMTANSEGRMVLDFDADDTNALSNQTGIVDATTGVIDFSKITDTTPTSRKFTRNGNGITAGDGDYYAWVSFAEGKGADGGYQPFRFVFNKTYAMNLGEDEHLTLAAADANDPANKDTQYKNHVYLNEQTTATDITTAMDNTAYNSTTDAMGAQGQNIKWKLPEGKYLIRLHLGDTGTDKTMWYEVMQPLDMRNIVTIYNVKGEKYGTIKEGTRTLTQGDDTRVYRYATSWAHNISFQLPAGYDEFYVKTVKADTENKRVDAVLTRVSDDISYIPANTGVMLLTTNNTYDETKRLHREWLEVSDEPFQTYTAVDNHLIAVVEPQTFGYYDETTKKYSYLFAYYAPAATNPQPIPNREYYMGFWRQKPGNATKSSPNMAYLQLDENINPNQTAQISNLLKLSDQTSSAKDMPWLQFTLDEEGGTTAITTTPTRRQLSVTDAIYTLQGVRVAKPLSPGIYIQNGKKIIIR